MPRQGGLFHWPLMAWVLVAFLVVIVGFGAVQLSSEVQAIEGDVVQQALQQGKPTIAEFGSDTCATCQQMATVLQQLEQGYGGQLAIAHVNIVKQPEYTTKYRIMLMPTQVFFDANGNETGRHMGALTQQEILDALSIKAGKS
jgi:thioredoxin 1